MEESDLNTSTEKNRKAWNANRFEAWTLRYGSPATEAARIVAEPQHVARRILPCLGTIAGKRICNVQGSHGRLAIALTLMGADVHVFDFADENKKFAVALVEAAGVKIDYTVCDVISADQLGLQHKFDTLVLEFGILHYHHDLDRFFEIMRHLAAKDGVLVLNEFHPVQRKLFWSDGPLNYFFNDIFEADVPNPQQDGVSLGTCEYRFWSLGEIVSSAVKSGFQIRQLDEQPDPEDAKIPGTFTLVAKAA